MKTKNKTKSSKIIFLTAGLVCLFSLAPMAQAIMGSSTNYDLESADFNNGGGSGSSTNYNLDTAVIGDNADGSIISHNYQICSGLVQEAYATCDDPAPPAPPEPPEPPNPPSNPPTSGAGGDYGDPPIGNYPDEEPVSPEQPGEPEVPSQPENPNIPETPSQPEQPGLPTTPESPVPPSQPTRPSAPCPSPTDNSGLTTTDLPQLPTDTSQPGQPGQRRNLLDNLLPILAMPQIFIPQIFLQPAIPVQQFQNLVTQNIVFEILTPIITILTPANIFVGHLILPSANFTTLICPGQQRTFFELIHLNNLNLQPLDTDIYSLSDFAATIIIVLIAVLAIQIFYYYYIFWLSNFDPINLASAKPKKRNSTRR